MILLAPTAVHAQRYLGAISGVISDPSGAKVAGAKVTATEGATKFATVVQTSGAGTYNMPALQPGTYTITVEAQGFRKETRSGVVLTAGQSQLVDFSLSVGTATETVEVSAENSLIDTGSANIATTLSNQEVTDLPNNGRNPYVMATLAAGVINGGSGGYFQGKSSQFTNPFSGVAVQLVTDGSGGHNRLTLDGIPNDSAERLSGASYTNFVPSPEAVQEVKVQTSIFDAEVGHGNGTVTNTVVRSGNNHLHGAAYYVFQNTYLNANTSEKALTNAPRNNSQLSQTGFVLDGPVYIPKIYDGHDKTFFMVAYERYASHQAINYSSRMPTQAERGGDFSDLCSAFDSNGLCTSGVQIYDPQSPIDSFGNRTQYFANNKIPSGRVTSVGTNLLSYYPLPNVPGASATGGTNYIATQTSYASTYPSFIVRFDQAIGSKNKVNVILFRSGLTQQGPHEGFPKEIGPGDCGVCFYHVYRNNRGGSIDDVQQFSDSMVLDSRLGILYHPFGLVYPDATGYDLSKLGISSTGLPYTSFPGVSPSGYAQLPSAARGQVSTNMTGALEEVLTKTIRTHTLRFGFEGNLIRYNVQNPQSGFGTFNFDDRFTQKNYQTGDPNSGNAMAALLLGAYTSTSYNITPAYALQQIYMAPFVQDDWRVTPKLTLNLGVRWDYESPFTDRHNRQVSGFCTTCDNPLQVPGLALKGGLQYTSSSNRFPYPRDLNNFQPRIGVAYQMFPNTVLRAGYGIIYFNTLESPIGTGFSQGTSYNNYLANTPLNTIDNPFPTGVLLPTGSSQGLSSAIGQGVSFYDPHHVQPKSTQYSVSVQQGFGNGMALQVAYVGARPTQLEVNHNINIVPTQYWNQGGTGANYLNATVANPMYGLIPQNPSFNGKTIKQSQLLLPFPEFQGVTENGSSIGSAPYNALQVQVSRRMRHHVSFQANLTWDKVMLHTFYYDDYSAGLGKLASQQDANPTLFGNIFGTVELPKLLARSFFVRQALGGWKLNTVARFSNGPMIGVPGGYDVIGNYVQPHQTYAREFNTCYESASLNSSTGVVTYTQQNTQIGSNGAPVHQACDTLSSTPAFRQRIAYQSQNYPAVLKVREPLKPLMDLSVFKQFILREGLSFEIRGEFFNVMNTPNYGGPSTSLGAANAGSVLSYSSSYPKGFFTQANDPRLGQLTARLNF
ncbi:TonB-dependent receptor [Edaphobacter sp.]|uniref:TonB-dependent receptor n=1 Tax=Edaphobacter sp. TaxID=1934404 RepID=UPI002DBD2F72|nr:TonB-dependent receptor [Edaphobacter sp.]HEU5340815.1 TonB-dependent receptor [Edaphobacter sp.]